MGISLRFDFIMELVYRWVMSLNDLLQTFITTSVTDVLSKLININDNFPFVELLNIILIPLKNILLGTEIGSLSVLEFTLGFGFGIYMIFTLFRWLWNLLPVV